MPDGWTKESHKKRGITTNKVIGQNSALIYFFIRLIPTCSPLTRNLFNIIGFSIMERRGEFSLVTRTLYILQLHHSQEEPCYGPGSWRATNVPSNSIDSPIYAFMLQCFILLHQNIKIHVNEAQLSNICCTPQLLMYVFINIFVSVLMIHRQTASYINII